MEKTRSLEKSKEAINKTFESKRKKRIKMEKRLKEMQTLLKTAQEEEETAAAKGLLKAVKEAGLTMREAIEALQIYVKPEDPERVMLETTGVTGESMDEMIQ